MQVNSTGGILHPRLLPGLIAASVCMTPWMGRPVLPELISRPVPLMTPGARLMCRQRLDATVDVMRRGRSLGDERFTVPLAVRRRWSPRSGADAGMTYQS